MARTALQIMADHAERMESQNAEVILQDYADDAVVMVNLYDHPLVGREEITRFINDQLIADGTMETIAPDKKKRPVEYIWRMGDETKGVHVGRLGGTNITAVETYVVKDDKIVFESAYLTME